MQGRGLDGLALACTLVSGLARSSGAASSDILTNATMVHALSPKVVGQNLLVRLEGVDVQLLQATRWGTSPQLTKPVLGRLVGALLLLGLTTFTTPHKHVAPLVGRKIALSSRLVHSALRRLYD